MISSSDILNARILIADDQEANVSLLEQMLRAAGYVSIEPTTNPRDVIKLHQRNRYDLILLDLQMPGMDGFEVMDGLKAIETSGYLPILVITAQPGHKLRALKAGAKDFVSKPFDLAEVLARVRNMLEICLLHMETRRLFERVSIEQKLSERLLLNVPPQAIAERLKGRSEVAGNSFTEIIADIVDFTKFSESLSAESLVNVLNDVFSRFDGIADIRGLEKIKTIGDAYMAVA
jgi:adenylate cyclase